ncbi:MAG: NAD(P)-dependent oxidoreductase [Pseudomonadota bacterium]
MAGQSITIIGAGNMGGAMAGNLLGKGWTVDICDINPDVLPALQAQGASVIDAPCNARPDCTTFIVSVVDAPQTEEVLFGDFGLARVLKPGACVMLCPTIGPEDVENFARRLATLGVHAVDAPMSGGPVRAAEGSMSLMVACDEAVHRALRPVLDALSSKVFHIGSRPGDGARTKLVNNLLAGINLVGAAEALAMAERMGLDVARTLEVIEQSSGQSWIGSDRMRRALAGDYAPRAHVTLLEKDTRLAVEAARQVGFEGPLGDTAAGVFRQAHQQGMAGLDDAALYRLLSQK